MLTRFLLLVGPFIVSLAASETPNILWITSEDNSSQWLQLYAEDGAKMPHLETLAETSVVFENAYANAPVCSVARSTLITGCYAPRIAAQFHRKSSEASLPGSLRMFPYYLRQAGYYTTNNAKKDYNVVEGDGVWDLTSREATYRDRAEGQPFFHVQNIYATHESSLHFSKEEMADQNLSTDPSSMNVFPYHPDTETFRYTYARYHDQHKALDREIGKLLRQLEEDGQSEDTIVFYFGDHGGVLPRSKGYLYESGLKVPLVVHVPKKWAHLSPFSAGSRAEPFVSFVDFAPTILNLLGIPVPEEMDGEPFLGANISATEVQKRDETFGYADRFDERAGFTRSLRVGNFKYIRNFLPFNPDALRNNYRYGMLAYTEWRELHEAGKLTPEQDLFFHPLPAEALYDLSEDPHEIHNLAADPAYADELARLRIRLQTLMASLPDLSLYPESVLLEEAIDNPVAFGKSHNKEIRRLLDTANLAVLPFPKAKRQLAAALRSPNPWQRYWAWIACSSFGEEAIAFEDEAIATMQTAAHPLVKARAAQFLALAAGIDPGPALEDLLRTSNNYTEANSLLNIVTQLRDSKYGYRFQIDENWFPEEWTREANSNVSLRLNYLNTPR